jgi:hypothetical protein
MRKSDRIIFAVVLGVLFPVLFALVAGTAGYYFSSDERMPYFVAAGLLTGFMIDIFLLKRLVTRVFDLPLWIVGVFYILCNVFIYGFFMGFPAFNVLMAIVAGYYAGRRIVILNIVPPEKEVLIRKVLLFSVVIIILV